MGSCGGMSGHVGFYPATNQHVIHGLTVQAALYLGFKFDIEALLSSGETPSSSSGNQFCAPLSLIMFHEQASVSIYLHAQCLSSLSNSFPPQPTC
ncbi:hypothetical protein V6N13_137820 [Hibiscus sabdariffa]|uniref:Uncharacterized protein n=1 Tax=Hibiscus sabdariffa TaxID=183260 RepID=A0ABR2DJG5_9ROSI